LALVVRVNIPGASWWSLKPLMFWFELWSMMRSTASIILLASMFTDRWTRRLRSRISAGVARKMFFLMSALSFFSSSSSTLRMSMCGAMSAAEFGEPNFVPLMTTFFPTLTWTITAPRRRAVPERC
jgi:hypothetical protein